MIEKISVMKKNESQLLVDCDSGILMELNEYFSFFVDGYKYMPLYRNKVWDGKIRLFSYATGQIYTGLYPYILNWCKENDVQVVDGTKIQDTKIDDSYIILLDRAIIKGLENHVEELIEQNYNLQNEISKLKQALNPIIDNKRLCQTM